MPRIKIDAKWWKISLEEEYKRNINLKQTDVDIVQEWLNKQPYLPSLNGNQIVMFLRVCDYSLEQTKMLIDLNYTMRTNLTEFFNKRNVNNKTLENVMGYLQLAVIPPSKDGDTIIVCRPKEVDLSKFNNNETIKFVFMVHDVTHLEYGSTNAYIYIIDMKQITFNLILRMQIAAIGNMLKFWQDCSTYRIKEIHIVNGGQVFKRILQIFQQFLKRDFVDVIHVHDDYDSLKKSMNSNHIPEDYGGTCASLDQLNYQTIETVKHYNEWFIEEEKQRITDKNKVTGKHHHHDLQGSFRKLNLD